LPSPPPAYGALSAEDLANLDRARDWVKGHFTDSADEKYDPVDGKLRLIHTILGNGWVASSETPKLQSLGVTFGDAIAQELLMEWVIAEDEYGRSPVLNWPGTTLICSPITMISKRIEDGEAVDAYRLFESVCGRMKELAFSADSI
jgi:hypothetical protein